MVSLNTVQQGCHGGAAGWNEYTRGIATMRDGADDDARALGMNPVTSNSSWDHENTYIGFYRHWRELLAVAAE